MNDDLTDFEVALDDLLQVARHAPRTGEGYQEIQAARRAFLAAFPPPAPGEVRLTLRQQEARKWQSRLRRMDADEGLDATEVHLLAALNVALAAAATPGEA